MGSSSQALPVKQWTYGPVCLADVGKHHTQKHGAGLWGSFHLQQVKPRILATLPGGVQLLLQDRGCRCLPPPA
jgi:hypothetical protein